MAYALDASVQGVTAVVASGVVASFPGTPTTGNLLVACVTARPDPTGGGIPTLAVASGGNPWTSTGVTAESDNHRVEIFYRIAGASEALSVTATPTLAGKTNFSIVLDIYSFSGFTGTPTLDKVSVGDTTSNVGSIATGSTGTLTAADEVVVSLGTIRQSSGTLTDNASLTLQTQGTPQNRYQTRSGYKFVSATTAQNVTWTLSSGTASAAAAIATFYDVTGGGGTAVAGTPTTSASVSDTATVTATATVVGTATTSASVSDTATVTATATVVGTATTSASVSDTGIITATASVAGAPTTSASVSDTADVGSVLTAAVTGTPTTSASVSDTATVTATATVVGTATTSATVSDTGVITATATVVGSPTTSATVSATADIGAVLIAQVDGLPSTSSGISATATITATATVAGTAATSATVSATATITIPGDYAPAHAVYVVTVDRRTLTIKADGDHVLSTVGDALLTQDGEPLLTQDGDPILTSQGVYRSRRHIIPVERRTLEVPDGS